jgi:hypothetical protein
MISDAGHQRVLECSVPLDSRLETVRIQMLFFSLPFLENSDVCYKNVSKPVWPLFD